MPQHDWPHAPPDVRSLADRLIQMLLQQLGSNVIGIYLHGSLAMGGFQPQRSDLDVAVVTKEVLHLQLKKCIAEQLLILSAQPTPIELHICTMDQLHPWRHPCPYDMHYGEDWRQAITDGLSEGTAEALSLLGGGKDPDLAAHMTVTRQRGVKLWGKSIVDAIPVVPREHYLDSVIADVDVPFSAVSKQPVYYVLNLLRVVRAVTDGSVLSKEEAGVWGLSSMPFHIEVIAMALQFYRQPVRNEALHFDVEPLRLFIKSCRKRFETRDVRP